MKTEVLNMSVIGIMQYLRRKGVTLVRMKPLNDDSYLVMYVGG